MISLLSHSPEETLALGEQWGRAVQAGWIIGLTGDLGAGKTQFVKGIARGLGYLDRIHSPTFALVHEYIGGRLPLYHLDLYRLDTPAQVVGAGLEEYFYQDHGVTVVEWAERWMETPPAGQAQPSSILHPPSSPGTHYRRVRIETLNDHERRISYEDFGA